MSIRAKYYLALSVLVFIVIATVKQYWSHQTELAQQKLSIDYIVVETPYVDPEPIEPSEPDVDEDELQCLAKNIYHEARGESKAGKLAVAHVTLNRVHSSKFPNTVCGVVYDAVYSKWWYETHGKLVPVRNMCQFSWYCDGKSDRIQLTTLEGEPIVSNVKAWSESQEVALEAMLGLTKDNTDGATYYYNPKLADPHWKHSFVTTTVVGNHKFMRTRH